VDDRSPVLTSVASAGPVPPFGCPPAGVRHAHLPQSSTVHMADPAASRGRRGGIQLTTGVPRTRPGSCGRPVGADAVRWSALWPWEGRRHRPNAILS